MRVRCLPGMLGGSEVGEAEAIELLNAAGCDGERAIEAYEDFAPGSSAREKLTYALTDTLFRNSMVRIMDASADAGSKCWSWMCTWESDHRESARDPRDGSGIPVGLGQ